MSQVPDDSLLIAELKEMVRDGRRFKAAHFGWLPDTWREKLNPGVPPVAFGKLLSYLNPVKQYSADDFWQRSPKRRRRVVDRSELQLGIPEELLTPA